MSIPYIFYSRPNERSAADVSTRGIGFNNSYSVDKNNSITYSASASSTIYNKVARKEVELADNANNDIYTVSVGNNYTFSGVNLITFSVFGNSELIIFTCLTLWRVLDRKIL